VGEHFGAATRRVLPARRKKISAGMRKKGSYLHLWAEKRGRRRGDTLPAASDFWQTTFSVGGHEGKVWKTILWKEEEEEEEEEEELACDPFFSFSGEEEEMEGGIDISFLSPNLKTLHLFFPRSQHSRLRLRAQPRQAVDPAGDGSHGASAQEVHGLADDQAAADVAIDRRRH